MTGQRVPSKAKLLERLTASRDHVLATVRALPAESLDEGRYENGWNGRQILAHVASIEWTYPRLFDLARIGGSEAEAAVDAFDVHAYNQRQVDKREDKSIPDLIGEFERNRDATIATLESSDEELLSTHVKSAAGVAGPLGDVLRYVAVKHVKDHVAD